MDIVIPSFMIIFVILDQLNYFDGNDHTNLEGSLQATMSLFIWLKFLYFLRIFSSTGYLIRIVIDVIKDMRYFLLIFFLCFIAFGDSLY